ncbi:DNA-directed RNA polymerases II, IV and V subunit 8B-like [Herrania umbratica]|uniref:DNA-directed RNA polymerases II, IV and V subunit 8B-like n=1 Tax=Herrania umbratica TaxID=108875 RepID=A0A6J1BCX3_9ROSI|nr:DNA-directed RNA polymerases II, IV and V subunit 8B-like [Herrania umbratica]
MSKADHVIFQQVFDVYKVHQEINGVTLIEAQSQLHEIIMLLEVDTERYPMKVGDIFLLSLAYTLSLDGETQTDYNSLEKKETLADSYEYVRHGKLNNVTTENETGTMEINFSFGDLSMLLKGNPSRLSHIEHENKLFLLISKLPYKKPI